MSCSEWCDDLCLPAEQAGRWTVDSIRQFAAKQQAGLPLAEMQPGSVIKVTGCLRFFSQAPLLNPQWTDGRMSQAE